MVASITRNAAPDRYVEWINAHLGFNPRSQANSNALSYFIVDDICSASPAIERLVRSEQLVPHKNASVSTKVTIRNVDLVLYEKENLPKLSIRLSVEHKTVMTAHGKARLNRYGDIIAYCNHMHNHRRDCVVGATVVINASDAYENPDTFARGLVRPKFNMERLVKDTSRIFTQIPLRENSEDPNDQPEALAVIVVDYDGLNPARLVNPPFAEGLTSGNYTYFIERLVEKYSDRFCV